MDQKNRPVFFITYTYENVSKQPASVHVASIAGDIFTDGRWRRLKQYRRCQRWFYDTAKKISAQFCSYSCKDRWWSRCRREAARNDL